MQGSQKKFRPTGVREGGCETETGISGGRPFVCNGQRAFFHGQIPEEAGIFYPVGRRGVIRICALDIRICVLSCINSQMG